MGDKWETSVKWRSKTPRVGDKRGRKVETHATQGTQSGRQGGDKWKLMPPKEARVGDKRGRQVGDKCKLMRPKEPTVGDKGETRADKGETSVNPLAQGTQSGRQVWETSVGDKSGRQVGDKWETCGRQVGDMWETSVNSCGPRHPE